MSVQHHGDNEKQIRRFLEEITGTARREFPDGRIGADDDGSLTYAMATDDRHRVIRIRFPKPVEWIALNIESAEQLRDQLTERIMSLKGVVS